jgi:hypothetical protein
MIAPAIHLNGTSGEVLLDQVCSAGHAVATAMKALEDAWPNGRDYYPLGDDALRRAESEWKSRIDRLRSVQQELEQLAGLIADKMGG